jgi:SIR2-like domain
MAERTLVNIPTELLEQVERGNVLLFIGERLSHDPAGEAVLDHLTAELAERAGLANDSPLTFPEIAQAYEDERGRQALVDFVCRRIEELGDAPQPVHRLIAGLTQCSVLVTTTLSGRLEQAFREAGRKLQVVIRNQDIAFEDEQAAQLYKLRGSLDQRDSLILTEDDNEQFFNDQDSVSVVLQGYFARKTILFIGYNLEDDHFKRLYGKITASHDPYSRRSYAFGETPPPNVAHWCKRKGIDVVKVNTTDFLQALADQLKVGLLLNFGRKRLQYKRILQPRDVAGWPDRIQRYLWNPKL